MMEETEITPESIASLQLKLFNQTLKHCQSQSPYYRRTWTKVRPLESLDDIASLPFTEKGALAKDADDFVCVERDQIADICTTSGSTGDPLMIRLTEGDLQRLGRNEHLSFQCAGLKKSDVVLVAATVDKCFIAGLAYYLGLRALGATVVRVGPSSPEMLLQMAKETKATVLVGVPTYFARVMDYAHTVKFPTAELSIHRLILIGEPIRTPTLKLNPLGQQLKSTWGENLHSTYGATELQTSFCECQAGQGGHLHPELLHVETIRDDGTRAKPGEAAEVVATPFGIQGMPLLRYKTGDIAALFTEPCSCGLKTPRLGPITGRKGQKLKLKGTTVYPQAIYNVLDECSDIKAYVLVAKSTEGESESLKIELCLRQESPSLVDHLKEKLKGRLKITPELSLSSAEEIEAIQRSVSPTKKTKFVDRRQWC